jgi:hypothetical protein
MNRLVILSAAILLSIASAFAQNQVQVISTGKITKIDAKKMTLKVQSDPNQPDTTGTNQGAGGARRPGGGGGGIPGVGLPGGGRRRGGGYPGGGPGGTGTSQNQGREFKVSMAKEVIVKEGEATIPFSTLKMGDHIIITGNPKGNDIEATTITKDAH